MENNHIYIIETSSSFTGLTTLYSCHKSPHHISTDSTIFRWQGAKGREIAVLHYHLIKVLFSQETRWSIQLGLLTYFISFARYEQKVV